MTAMPTLADLEAAERNEDGGGDEAIKGAYREEVASVFHTNLRLVAGEQPLITENKVGIPSQFHICIPSVKAP
jgi:hypothetical protein